MKMAFCAGGGATFDERFPLNKGDAAERRWSRSGWGLSGRPSEIFTTTPCGKGDFQRSFSCRVAAPRSMKTASPLGQGGTSGGF
jgi:hypothetical protein